VITGLVQGTWLRLRISTTTKAISPPPASNSQPACPDPLQPCQKRDPRPWMVALANAKAQGRWLHCRPVKYIEFSRHQNMQHSMFHLSSFVLRIQLLPREVWASKTQSARSSPHTQLPLTPTVAETPETRFSRVFVSTIPTKFCTRCPETRLD
jgi:hypothetical protein